MKVKAFALQDEGSDAILEANDSVSTAHGTMSLIDSADTYPGSRYRLDPFHWHRCAGVVQC